MRIATCFVVSSFALSLVLAACGDSKAPDADPFDTLQDCYDEHAHTESLPVQEAIVVCCLDHPIGNPGVHPSCTDTQVDCVSHVRAELDISVTDAEIEAACTTYISQKDG